MIRPLRSAAAAIILASCLSATAQPMDDIASALSRGDYATALQSDAGLFMLSTTCHFWLAAFVLLLAAAPTRAEMPKGHEEPAPLIELVAWEAVPLAGVRQPLAFADADLAFAEESDVEEDTLRAARGGWRRRGPACWRRASPSPARCGCGR